MSFINRNVCRTFKITASGSLQAFADQECSEVIVKPRALTYIYDCNNFTNGFQLSANEEFTFRGVTNSNQVSALGGGDVYYRTQFFSNMPGL